MNDKKRPALPEWLRHPIVEFFETEASGGIVLILATVAALMWANSGWRASYFDLWHTTVGLSWGDARFKLSLHHWINDGLMALFFFYVGLEIKREVLSGELASAKKAALPAMAALGGMLVPAAFYAALNFRGDGAPGWGVPMATDIAFAIGVLMLLGDRVPLGLKVFLTALAVVDDLGAVVVIAIFYTAELAAGSLLLGFAVLAALFGLARLGVTRRWVYVLGGFAVWIFFLRSGVHATVAGVLTAMAVPHRGTSLLQDLEHGLGPWVSYCIMPVFALANAGVEIDASAIGRLILQPVPLGVILGLVLGKQIGILGFSWLAVKLGWASLPEGVGWRRVHGAAVLGGIGFTMSLFIANLAFGEGGLLEPAKMGILAGSLISAILGAAVLLAGPRPTASETTT